ncbi:hypothetical protein [Stenotrophomonas phage RAS14]
MYLLTEFIKAWHGHEGKIKWKRIKCRLWFDSLDKMKEFVDENTEIKNYVPHPADGNYYDKDNAEKWDDYYTKEMTFSK